MRESSITLSHLKVALQQSLSEYDPIKYVACETNANILSVFCVEMG